MEKKVFYIIDGSSLLYRGYYGVKPLHAPDGTPVQAVYSFCRMLHAFLMRFNPTHIAIAWDSPGKTVRHELFADYKIHRQVMPSDLSVQKTLIKEFIALIGVAQIDQTGIEADDLIFSLAHAWCERGADHTVLVVTSDKDMGQMVNDAISYFDPVKDIVYDVPVLTRKLGFPIDRLPFYYALVGDAADNIPGVKGVGQATALDLVNTYASLDDLYANIDSIKNGRVAKALRTYKQDAYLSLQLFLLQRVPLNIDVSSCTYAPLQWSQAAPFFERFGFISLKKTIQHTPEEVTHTLQERIAILSQQYDFQVVTTSEQLQNLVTVLREAPAFAYDVETDAQHPRVCQLVGISFAVDGQRAWYIPLAHINITQLSLAEVRFALGSIFTASNMIKIAHNAAFDLLVLRAHEIMVVGPHVDTMVAASLVTKVPGQRIGLKDLAFQYGGVQMITYEQIVVQQGYKNFGQVPVEQGVYYAANDALQTMRLYSVFKELLAQEQLMTLADTIEFPLIPLLVDMEYQGMSLDTGLLSQYSKHITDMVHDIEKQVTALIAAYAPAIKTINLNSPKQIEQLLFVELKLEPIKKSKKTERYSTDYEVLVELAKQHPVPALIVRHRELIKLKGTYLDGLPAYVLPQTGKVHTHFSQTRVATGRLSSSDPNLQNIPADAPYGVAVRAAFKPSDGYLFLSADYSQIELRILAHVTQDPSLVAAFISGVDIHQQTAATLFGIEHSRVTHEQRQLGKRINFSIIYGLTPYGLSKDLGISMSQARTFIDAYFAQYAGVKKWIESVEELVKQRGYTQTLWGRRRYLPAIYERNKNLYEEARRAAVNTVIQGTQAELVKKAMIVVDAYVKKNHPQVRMVLQIHDELLFEVPTSDAVVIEKQVKRILEEVISWSVPLVVTTRIGDTWQAVSK